MTTGRQNDAFVGHVLNMSGLLDAAIEWSKANMHPTLNRESCQQPPTV